MFELCQSLTLPGEPYFSGLSISLNINHYLLFLYFIIVVCELISWLLLQSVFTCHFVLLAFKYLCIYAISENEKFHYMKHKYIFNSCVFKRHIWHVVSV